MLVTKCKVAPALIGLLSTLLISQANATSFKDMLFKDTTAKSDNTWFFGLGGGPAWLGLKNRTYVLNGADAPAPFNQDKYTIKSPVSTGTMLLDVGYRWHEAKEYVPYSSLYLQYRHFFGTNIQGNVMQYSMPEFLNYKYRINYDADMFTLNGKLDLLEYKHFMPYIAGGIGVIINHLNDYNESAYPNVTPRISPGYNGNSSTSIAATLGAGIDYILTENVWLTLGYEHVFQGTVKSGAGVSSWSDTSLNMGNMSMDTVFLNVSVNFPQAFIRS